jgi:hypothetical protein
VDSFPILRHWYVVHRQGKRLSPVAEAFKDFVVRDADSLIRPAPVLSQAASA